MNNSEDAFHDVVVRACLEPVADIEAQPVAALSPIARVMPGASVLTEVTFRIAPRNAVPDQLEWQVAADFTDSAGLRWRRGFDYSLELLSTPDPIRRGRWWLRLRR